MSLPGSPTRHLPPIRSGFSGVIGGWSYLVDPSAPSINSEGYGTRFTEPRLPSLMIQSSKPPPVDVPSEAFKASPPDGSYCQTIPELDPGRPSHPIEPRGHKRPLPESQTNDTLPRESGTLQVHGGFVHTTGQPVLYARSKRRRAESPKPSSPSHRQRFTTHPPASRPIETSVSFQANQPISEPNSRESVVHSSAVAERPETRPDGALPDSQNNANQGLLDKLMSYDCDKIPSNNSSKQGNPTPPTSENQNGEINVPPRPVVTSEQLGDILPGKDDLTRRSIESPFPACEGRLANPEPVVIPQQRKRCQTIQEQAQPRRSQRLSTVQRQTRPVESLPQQMPNKNRTLPPRSNVPQKRFVSISNRAEYEIENLADVRMINGQVEFQVIWLATWVTIDDLRGARILNDAERLQEENAERLEREKAEYLRENEAEALREEKADQLREGRADPSWPKARQSKVRRLQ
ncbi:hypothetical protein PT974_09908 [Cladobotryum mycophilum]|uniref:Uncharacterized protein n=1 Tax=Cladobotryum mycophilum TaxID=491253 RepID=A0ABR0SHJ9_9HYPO